MSKEKKQQAVEEKETVAAEETAPAEETAAVEETAPEQSAEEKLQAELDAQKEQYMRVLAEYANYKRRTEQEKTDIGQFAKADLLETLLPILDNLDRACEAPDGPEYRQGVEMIVRQLHDTFGKIGVTELNPLGEPFDPELHNAIQREDAEDGVEPDTVTQVFQNGYKFGDRLIRPAIVKVAN